jgi:ABC-type dipeptide/oligopeptide/nickel transport system ATPase component
MTPVGSSPLLEISDLRVEIASPRGFLEAVDGVSFSIAPREVVGIVGESGCGKSMLALSIMRLVPRPGRITAGSIVLAGRNLLGLSEREMRQVRGREIGMIFQDPSTALNPVMRVGRQIEETIEAHGTALGREAWARSVDALRAVRIPEPAARARDYPHQYSGGMRQRAVIAIGTANRPHLLIADEPTTALDVTVQAQIMDLLLAMNRETGTAIILITHNIALVSRFCSRVLVMYAGRIVESGPTQEVFDRPGHP